MYFRNFFVLNRVRVSNSQRLTYTQILVEYPPGGVRISTGYSMKGDECSFQKNCTLNFIPLDIAAIQHKYKKNINHNLSLTYFFGFVLQVFS